MEVRRKKCWWCERTYAVMDSTATFREGFCSTECEAERNAAWDECEKWYNEINDAWRKAQEEYEMGDDEINPCSESPCCDPTPDTRRRYLAFKTRYQKWKSNHCWKNSFWAWDPNEDSGGSFFGGGGGGDGGGAGGLVMLVLKGIGILVAIWIGWVVIKGVWNGIFGGGGSEEITEAAIMEKWQEHLEKRRDAFDDGLPEKEIEAKGLKNYTWAEWQEKFRKEHEAADKPKAEKKEVQAGGEDSAVKKAKEIGDQAMSAAKGLGGKAKSLWQNLTSKEAKNSEAETNAKVVAETMTTAEAEGKAKAEAEAKAKAEAEIRAKAEAESAARKKVETEARAKFEAEARTRAEAEARARVEAEAKAKAEAEARTKAEAEAKRLAETLARKEAEEKAQAMEQARAKMAAEARAKAEVEARVKAEIEAKRLAEEMARKEAEAKARAEAETLAKAKTGADAKPKDSTVAEGAVVGQQGGGVVHKASKDSKGIRIIVQGKGKTKDAAVRWAIRDAVWKTVGKWVDSKARIKENHDKVVAQVKTITEVDVPKFEVMDTQVQDGGFIVKVKVSVSKKRIAPKFAEIFPDVFGNAND